MVQSINNNYSSAVAIREFGRAEDVKDKNSQRISTGLRVKQPQDDSASFQISSRLNGQVAGITAAQQTQGFAQAVTSVASAAGQVISDRLVELKGLAVQLQSGGLDAASKQAIQDQISAGVSQVNGIASAASFNGVNLLQDGQSVSAVNGEDGSTTAVQGQAFDAAGLGIANLDFSDSSSVLASINNAIGTANSKLSTFGSAEQQLQRLGDFSSQIKDSLKRGVGELVDADLGAEAAKRAAADVKSKLSGQSLNIANASGRQIGSLFSA